MKAFQKIVHSLGFRLIFWVGLFLLVVLGIGAYYSVCEKSILVPAAVVFIGVSSIIGIFLWQAVSRPIKKLIKETQQIGRGDFENNIPVDRQDEIGDMALAIDDMRQSIADKQEALNNQWREYQALFEGVPCFITVQDRDLRLIRYNREFSEAFSPKVGDYCYKAYKGRKQRCESCPVIETFKDGQPHYSEEQGINKDGTESYWMVRTSPIKNAKGEVIYAMEMSLDLTQVRWLEKEAKKSEEKYRLIFNTIPNPVFVLDRENLEILDCNERVAEVYGFSKEEILNSSFINLFVEDQREEYASAILSANFLPRTTQVRKDGQSIFANIRVSSSEYAGRDALLVSTTDVTTSLLAQQQLIQSGKMATLGEMATGIAHELNQPLSVIKTASSYLIRKVRKREPIDDRILETMAEEVEGHVDRASKIINHMREFSRKSEAVKEKVQLNDILGKSLEFFSQQFKLREIRLVRDFQDPLPVIFADGNRLEQVFINLLTNARDAIEKKSEGPDSGEKNKTITVRTRTEEGMVTVRIQDTGTGIAEPVLNRIFEPFFTTKKVGKGTGIGLSISYGIVQDYDGIIKFKTKEGEGTTFIVQFPIPGEAI